MLVAVVVTYSTPAEVLNANLQALLDAGGCDHVVVVDTGGANAVEVPASIVHHTDNRGYGAAVNEGVNLARGLGATHVVVLNDDVTVQPGWLAPLRAEFDTDRTIGVAQPAIVDPTGAVSSLGVVLSATGQGTDIAAGAPASVIPDETYDLAIFTGAAFVASIAFFEATGGFDERFFLYYEDVDLALRGTEDGWRYRLVPASVVTHVGSASTSKMPGHTLFMQERNRVWNAARHLTPAALARAVWLSVRRLRHRPRGVHARALAAGLTGIPHRLIQRP